MKIIYLALIELEVYTAPRTHTIGVCNNLTKLGHNVLLLCPRPYKEKFNFTFEVVYLPFFGFGFIRELIYHFIETFYLIYFIIKFNPDIIYERESINLFPAIICKIFKKKHFIEVNGWLIGEAKIENKSKIYIMYIKLLQRLYYNLSACIIAVVDELKDKIVREYKINPSKIYVINNGVDTNKFYPIDINEAKEKIKLDKSYKYIGYIGSFPPWHDLETVIYSIKDIIKELPDVKLLLIGSGIEVDKYKKLVNNLNINKNVIFVSNIPHEVMPLYINSFNICIFPFVSGDFGIVGCPLKLLEYLACGKVTVLNKVACLNQFFEVTVPVEPQDKETLNRTLLDILQNFNNYEKLAKKARKLIEEKFTWEKTVRDIIKFVENFILL